MAAFACKLRRTRFTESFSHLSERAKAQTSDKLRADFALEMKFCLLHTHVRVSHLVGVTWLNVRVCIHRIINPSMHPSYLHQPMMDHLAGLRSDRLLKPFTEPKAS